MVPRTVAVMPVSSAPAPAGRPAIFRHVFHDSPAAVVLFDEGLSVVDANPAACTLLCRGRVDLVGLGMTDITHPDDAGVGVELARRLVAGEIPRFRIENRYLSGRGAVVWAECSAWAVQDVGTDGPGCIVILQDITAARRTALGVAAAVADGPPARELTDRELAVLELLVEGLDAKGIARRLGITINTCRGYLRTVMIKLGAHSQVEAVVIAARAGLVDLRPAAR